jgi:hypothetical protein
MDTDEDTDVDVNLDMNRNMTTSMYTICLCGMCMYTKCVYLIPGKPQ